MHTQSCLINLSAYSNKQNNEKYIKGDD